MSRSTYVKYSSRCTSFYYLFHFGLKGFVFFVLVGITFYQNTRGHIRA